MRQHCTLVMAGLMLAPSAVMAQAHPTRALPSGSQLYFHWDGLDKHQAAFEQSALGKTLKGDTGKFLHALSQYVGEAIRTGLANAVDAELAGAVKEELFGFCDTVNKKGLAVAIELRQLDPLDLQAMIVFPGGGGPKKSPYGLLQTLAKLDPTGQVRPAVVGKHKAQHVQFDRFHMVWWTDQGDLMLALGTNGPENVLKGTGKLMARPLYQQVHQFKEIDHHLRGFIDLQAIGAVVNKIDPKVEKITAELGLKAIKGLTFHSGFDGPGERSIVDLHIDGERKGILKLATNRTFTLADLPPLPPDLTDFSASTFDMGTLYDVSVHTAQVVAKLVAPNDAPDIKGLIKQVEQQAGVKFKEDLFDQFDQLFVNYAAWPEGFLGLGAVNLVKVKNGDKVVTSIQKLAKAVNDTLGGFGFTIDIKKTDYRGVAVYQIDMGKQTMGTAPAFAVHNGWLAYASYPQPIQGFILRSKGELPTWKAGKQLQKLLEPFPKEFTGIAVSDPRPACRTFLSLLPTGVAILNGVTHEFAPGIPQFDVSLIPNAYEATRYLFPSITVTTDNGKRLRSETRSPF